MLVDLTQPELDTLNTLLSERVSNGPTITSSTLQSELLAANASYKSPADFQDVVVAATTLNVERRGKYNWVSAHGASGIATVTSIAASGIYPFTEGDQIHVQARAGSWLYMQLPTQALTINLIRSGNFVTYVLTGGQWAVLASNPEIRRVIAQPLERIVCADPTLVATTENIGLRYITGETRSGGGVTISISGVSGGVSAYVDRGFGSPELLGTYTYSGSPSVTDVATGLKDAINLGYPMLHGFAASSAVAVVTIIPPDGLGSLADTYLLSTVDSGDCVSVALGFGLANGGTDAVAGVEADGTIEQLLTPAIDGTIVEITNEMASNTIAFNGPPAVGNLASSKTFAALTTYRLKYNALLAKWTHVS